MSAYCIICKVYRAVTSAITDKTFYVPVVTLSTEDNMKLTKQLKSGFKRAITRTSIKTTARPIFTTPS